MPVYFPQINSNLILTQLPYSAGLAFDTVVQDVETAMRWAFSRRANTDLPDDYSQLPLGKFNIGFSSITDAEVATLKTFFESMYGRYGEFRLLDPGGNLLPSSEDFTSLSWDRGNGPVNIISIATDPFGGLLATKLFGAGTDSYMLATLGPSDGGINGFVACVSVWVKANSANQEILLGFASFTGVIAGTTWQLPQNQWKRIFYSAVLWDDNPFRAILGSSGTWNNTDIDVFGFQVSPTKGEGPYVKSPDNYGYHPYVRFDTDTFQRQSLGPDQNVLQLPMFEFNVPD